MMEDVRKNDSEMTLQKFGAQELEDETKIGIYRIDKKIESLLP